MYTKTIPKLVAAVTIYGALAFSAVAEVVIVVHPSNNEALDTKEIKRFFLGKAKKFSNGKEVIPINQIAESPIRAMFDTDTLGRNSSQVSAYWSKLVFTGKGIPPKEVDNDAAVISIVADNQDAIGYVDSSSVDGSVKAISLN